MESRRNRLGRLGPASESPSRLSHGHMVATPFAASARALFVGSTGQIGGEGLVIPPRWRSVGPVVFMAYARGSARNAKEVSGLLKLSKRKVVASAFIGMLIAAGVPIAASIR